MHQKEGNPGKSMQRLTAALPDLSVETGEKTVAFGSLYFIGEIEVYLEKSFRENIK